ncbi:MAG: GDP-L-fucose synthase [Rubripirellula sp.]|nr:GDP-L-fucose synthase [Rubripirellula sp.]
METRNSKRLFIAGHRGMAGSAILRRFKDSDFELLYADRDELDLCDAGQVDQYFSAHRPDGVILAAAKVGGIFANEQSPVDFLTDNVLMATHVINAAFRHSVRRLLYLGSSCIYPRDSEQPIQENSLLSAPLEKTNEAYALAKIIGLKLCQAYRSQHGVQFHSVMPTNLYGAGDNYHRENSHVLPGLLRRFHEAKVAGAESVVIWGTGTARREFLHVDDLADAVCFVFGLADPPEWVNVGTGNDLTILALAHLIADVVGYQGEIQIDPSRPDGAPAKRLDMTLLHQLGWKHRIELEDGLKMTYRSFLQELDSDALRES